MARKKKNTQASIDTIISANKTANIKKSLGYSSIDESVYRRLSNDTDISQLLSDDCFNSSAYSGSNQDNIFTYRNQFNSNSKVNKQIIASCILAYFGYGIVKNVVDLFTDFTCSKFEIQHPKRNVKKFFDAWAEVTNLQGRMSSIASNLFMSANVFIHRHWSKPINSELINQIKRSAKTEVINGKVVVAEDSIEQDFTSFFFTAGAESNLNKIPIKYSLLNPLQMELRKKNVLSDPVWVLCLTERDFKALLPNEFQSSKIEIALTKVNIPNIALKQYSGTNKDYVVEVEFGPNDLYVLQDRKPDWFDWSIPFVWPALKALRFKDCLRNMEIKACDRIINTMFLFKLGNMDKGRKAEDEHFEKLAEMLQMPGQSLNLIWNEDIQAEVLQPDIKNIFDAAKHASADKDILTALGIPEVLVGGNGGNYSNSYVAVAAVMEKLQWAQGLMKEFINHELYLVTKAMGFQKRPTIKFGDSALSDKKSERSFLISLRDRGIISADTVLRSIDSDVDTESVKIKQEQELLEGPQKGPFENSTPSGGVGGRPSGKQDNVPRGKNSNKRSPKGKNLV